MNDNFKRQLLEIVQNYNEELVQLWIELFDDNEKDDEYRYYDDFLGFFEECLHANLDLHSLETEALQHFLEKIIEIKGEDSFFNFKDSVYTCYLKFPILKKMDDIDIIHYDNVAILTQFFEGITSSIIVNLLKKNNEVRITTMQELEEREAPIAKVWHNTIMVSIVGSLDSHRVLKIIDKILDFLDKSEIEHVIVDIGAIYDMNSEVARQIIKLNNAIHYMGSNAYLTGITPAIAKSLTHLDLLLDNIKTYSTTQKAMEDIIGK
jgi:anti-anti-sigma regulatory factor